MKRGKFDTTILTLCFAFLYIPILILVIYSFNASKLVTSGAGFHFTGIKPCGRMKG